MKEITVKLPKIISGKQTFRNTTYSNKLSLHYAISIILMASKITEAY